MFEKITIIGCGLMGGSFALGLRQAVGVKEIVGFSPSGKSTEKALEMGVIDFACTSPIEAVLGSDLVLIAVPVAATFKILEMIEPALEARTLIMDVGSTKTNVLKAAHDALGGKISSFVGAHPIAGKEKSGVSHADAALYFNRQVILTPDTSTKLIKVEQARSVWEALGCQVREMSASDHDQALAAVSHLPHLLSFGLMHTITEQINAELLLSLAGPGFSDSTRIAASDPHIWSDIFLANQGPLLTLSQQVRENLQTFENAILEGDKKTLQDLISKASETRENWNMQ